MIIWLYNSWCFCEYIIYQFIKSKPITEIKLFQNLVFGVIWGKFALYLLLLQEKRGRKKTVHIKRLTLKKQIYSARAESSNGTFWIPIYWVILQHQSTKIGTTFNALFLVHIQCKFWFGCMVVLFYYYSLYILSLNLQL